MEFIRLQCSVILCDLFVHGRKHSLRPGSTTVTDIKWDKMLSLFDVVLHSEKGQNPHKVFCGGSRISLIGGAVNLLF